MYNPIKDMFDPLDIRIDFSKLKWEEFSIHRPYVILFSGRCGSTLLCELLNSTGICGNPQEFFNENYIKHAKKYINNDNFTKYLHFLLNSQAKKFCFGFKIDAMRFFWLEEILMISSAFKSSSNLPVIWLTREDIVSQAFSFVSAKKSDIWHNSSKDSKKSNIQINEIVNEKTIWEEIISIIQWEQKIENLFEKKGFKPLRLSYEQLVADRYVVLGKIMIHIGFPKETVISTIEEARKMKSPIKRLVYKKRHKQVILFYYKNRQTIEKIISNRKKIKIDSDFITPIFCYSDKRT